MIDNPILTALRERRSAHRFTDDPVSPEQIDAILEAGRWAPSAANSQPWNFVVVADPGLRSRMGAILREVTWAWAGFAAAPAMIVVSVDPGRDSKHFVEAGAVAAQNLCLAAHSLGLASSWAGVYDHAGKGTAENDIKRLLGLPRTHRIIAVVPIGRPGLTSNGSRRPLIDMVHHDRFEPAISPAVAAADEPAMAPATSGSGAAG
jgi:nitroreductase